MRTSTNKLFYLRKKDRLAVGQSVASRSFICLFVCLFVCSFIHSLSTVREAVALFLLLNIVLYSSSCVAGNFGIVSQSFNRRKT